ncbi:protein Tex24-like [Mus pahari]|uniref:protein Tex24-like n=1 Tax=Mus pahari TaxID=10093 RepID=UPI000A30A4F1|nr:protein Tex24-like [Mus pahari]
MCSQRLNSTFLKVIRLPFTARNERSLEQTSGPATRSVTQGFNDLRVIPESRPDLGDQQSKSSLAELPSVSHGKRRKPDRLPRLVSSASKAHVPDPNLNLSIVSKRIFQGDSVVEGPEDRRTFVGHSGLPKKSAKATVGEAQGKKRAMELLNKARKQTDKNSNLIDIRQLPKQEAFMNINPCKKYPKQQPVSLEEWRRSRLEVDNTGLIQSPERFGCCERKKAHTQLLEITSLQAETKLELLKRRRMQLMEMSAKAHHDRGLCVENAVFLSGENIQLCAQEIHQGVPERNNLKPKSRTKAEVWDHTVQGTSLVLTARDHSYVPQLSKYTSNQWGCAEIFHSRDGRCTVNRGGKERQQSFFSASYSTPTAITISDKQLHVHILVCEGERGMAEGRNLLGEIKPTEHNTGIEDQITFTNDRAFLGTDDSDPQHTVLQMRIGQSFKSSLALHIFHIIARVEDETTSEQH